MPVILLTVGHTIFPTGRTCIHFGIEHQFGQHEEDDFLGDASVVLANVVAGS